MTLRHYGVLMVFVAIALAVMTPIARSAWGFWDFAMLASIEVPYALMIPTLFLVRLGPIKNWMVSVLCTIPLLAFLIYINFVAATGQVAPFALIHHPSPPIIVMVAVADSILLPILARLGRLVIPGRCPNCMRPGMLRDFSVPRSREFPRPRDARICLACGSRFRRLRHGPWFDVDELDGHSSGTALTPTLILKDIAR